MRQGSEFMILVLCSFPTGRRAPALYTGRTRGHEVLTNVVVSTLNGAFIMVVRPTPSRANRSHGGGRDRNRSRLQPIISSNWGYQIRGPSMQCNSIHRASGNRHSAVHHSSSIQLLCESLGDYAPRDVHDPLKILPIGHAPRNKYDGDKFMSGTKIHWAVHAR